VDSLQVENGFAWTQNTHNRYSVDFPESLFRLGVAKQTELRLQTPNYINSHDLNYWGEESHFSGIQDMAVGIKRELGPFFNKRFDLAVIPGLGLPSGEPALTSHHFDPFLRFPFYCQLKDSWYITGRSSLFWPTVYNRQNFTVEAAIAIERSFNQTAGMFLEYESDYPHYGTSLQTLTLGTSWRPTPRQQWDAHISMGFTRDTPKLILALGYSFRLDHLLKWFNQ
jgi:hypothetical protein